MEVTRSTETLVLTRGTRHDIPEDGIFIVTAVKPSTFSIDSSTRSYTVLVRIVDGIRILEFALN
jgi:hypothetical protein